MSEVEEWSRSKPYQVSYIRKIPRGDDWPEEFDGLVVADGGYVRVHAFWMRTNDRRTRWEQHIVLQRMDGDVQVWGRAKRPESRALSERGLTIMARKWARRVALTYSPQDADLIATAPEMLEALEELVDIEGPLPGTANWHAKVIAVIAKARGGDHA